MNTTALLDRPTVPGVDAETRPTTPERRRPASPAPSTTTRPGLVARLTRRLQRGDTRPEIERFTGMCELTLRPHGSFGSRF